jgi:hypothetical protein
LPLEVERTQEGDGNQGGGIWKLEGENFQEQKQKEWFCKGSIYSSLMVIFSIMVVSLSCCVRGVGGCELVFVVVFGVGVLCLADVFLAVLVTVFARFSVN